MECTGSFNIKRRFTKIDRLTSTKYHCNSGDFSCDDFAIKVKGFNSYNRQGSFNRRYHGGIATYIHESIPAEALEIVTKYHSVEVRINVKKNVTITMANIYVPGSATFEAGVVSGMIDQLPEPVIMMGDFNAHNTLWGSMNSDRRGRLLK